VSARPHAWLAGWLNMGRSAAQAIATGAGWAGLSARRRAGGESWCVVVVVRCWHAV